MLYLFFARRRSQNGSLFPSQRLCGGGSQVAAPMSAGSRTACLDIVRLTSSNGFRAAPLHGPACCVEGALMPTRRGDKWEARLKLAGRVVRTQRFDTKRAAMEWERRQRSAFDDHGYDPSRGKVAV